MKQVCLIAAACMFAIIGCQKKAPETIDAGSVENGAYSNKYFGFSMHLPSDWSVHDKATRKESNNAGKKLLSDEDPNLEAAIETAGPKLVELLSISKYPVWKEVLSNPSLTCVAEGVKGLQDIHRGKDYLANVKKLLESSKMKMIFPKEIHTEAIGGKEFDVLTSEMSLPGDLRIKQKQYCAIMKDYALFLVVSYMDEEGEIALKQILDSIQIAQ